MNEYTIAQIGKMWQVRKDGRFFCMATSEDYARKICASLASQPTPRVNQFRIGDVLPRTDKILMPRGFQPAIAD